MNMMKRTTKTKTSTYDTGIGFLVDVVDTIDERNNIPLWDIWLYRKSYGVKRNMFGLIKAQTPTEREVLKVVQDNLLEYMMAYDEEYGEE